MTNSMDVIQVKYGNQKTVSLTRFLNLDPEELTEPERKIQEAIEILYKKNEKDPPLFLEFPNSNKNLPLTIDTTTCTKAVGAAASYSPISNQIQFKTIEQVYPLVVSLAHELKHAEQNSLEMMELTFHDTYERAQLQYLEEAQAYAFECRVQYELFDRAVSDLFGGNAIYQEAMKKYEALPPAERVKQAEEDTIIQLLPKLWNGSIYTLEYEVLHPVSLNDKSYVKKLPKSLHLSNRILEKLKETPKIAQTDIGKVRQFVKTGDFDNVLKILEQKDIPAFTVQESFASIIQKGSVQQINRFLKIKNSEGKMLLSESDQKEIIQKNLALIENELDSKIDALFSLKNGKDGLLTEKDFRQVVHNCVVEGNKKAFNSLISRVTDSKGNLKLEKLSKNDKAFFSFICGWSSNTKSKSSESAEEKYQILKKILQLKDKNGERFITDTELAFELKFLFKSADIPSVHMLLKEITDQKGQLMVSDKNFEEVAFLDGIVESNFDFNKEKAQSNRYKLLSEFKSLKDRYGNPVISSKQYANALSKLAATSTDDFLEFSNFCTAISSKDLSLPCKQEELEQAKTFLKMGILLVENKEGAERVSFLFKLKDKDKVPLFSEQDLCELWDTMSQDPQKYKTILPVIQKYKKQRHFNNLLGQMGKKAPTPVFLEDKDVKKVVKTRGISSGGKIGFGR